MKRILTFMFLVVIMASLSAGTVNYEEAFNVADFLIQINGQDEHAIADVYEMKNSEGILLSYVFMLEPNGFIATSTDSDISPVIGYSFRNNFVAEDIWQNVGYQYLKKDMELRLEAIPFTAEEVKNANSQLWRDYLEENIESSRDRDEVWPPEGYSSTGGWVETQWNQSPVPYNTFCPIDPGTQNRCVVGCVATAMAQIINYHYHVGDVSFSDSDDYVSQYTSPYIYIDDNYNTYDFPSFPELNVYLDELKTAYENQEPLTNDMIAALSFAAGVSVEMGYSSEGSGAYTGDVPYALIYKFDYDTATLVVSINATFYNNLKNNMMNAKPVLLGVIESGSPYGHAIVCDGYNQTNNTYHLNLGWGGSQDGWYILPGGMPSGFNVITRAVINIEGGPEPFAVVGQVIGDNAPITETYITLDGPRFYECYVSNANGQYEIPYVIEGTYQATAIIELAGGGYFYKSFEVELTEASHTLIFYLDDYEDITGTVTASINPENTHINYYQDDILETSGVADASGDYTIAGVLPGTFTATASSSENYFDSAVVEITATNQEIDFALEEYQYEHIKHFAGDPSETIQITQNMSCGIRVAGDDIANLSNDFFSKVRFVAPFNPADGELFGQLWKGEVLITEKQIVDFVAGEWVEVVLEDFALIDTDAEYYIGYRLHSLSGAIPAAYHDDGPQMEGKGAYIRTSSWLPLSSYDFNFCIKGIAYSQTSAGSDENNIPLFVDQLVSNYPNPFNPETTIMFTTGNNANIEISIYNIKGQKIKTLANEKMEAGEHQVVWNGTDDNGNSVSSGIYFYKMRSDGRYTSTKKMILMK